MGDQSPSFRFEIDNFSGKEAVIASKVFVAGGCEWYISFHPKGDYRHYYSDNYDHLSLFLKVANRKSLRTGWKRSANYYFLVLNESGKELYRSSTVSDFMCAWYPAGQRMTLPPSKFQKKRVLEKDRLIIEVYIKVVEAFDGDGGDVPEKKETVDINGFQVFAAHVALVKKIFAEHVMKTEYKNTLSNACSKLSELAEVGSKLDWLKSKFDEISLKGKNADGADESLFQQLEERIKNLELMESGFKMDCLKSKLEEISLERKKSYDADGSRVQKLEESVKNLEMMELGFKLDNLKSKLEELSLERKKSYDADGSRVQKLEKSVKNLETMKLGSQLDYLELKQQISLERKKSYDADEFWSQKLEEQRVKDHELMELVFKLDSFKSKLEEISLERKTDESRFQQLKERVKNIELMELGYKLDCLNSKLDNADETRVQQLEERVKNIELMELGYKLDCLNSKLDNADESRVQQLEERVKDIELMKLGYKMNCLITKVDEVSLERKKLDDADGFRFQQLEESVKNIELMLSHLKVEMDKKKDKSSADGFLLVD